MEEIEKFFRFEEFDEENGKEQDKVCCQVMSLGKGSLWNGWLDGEFFGKFVEENKFSGIWVKRNTLENRADPREYENNWVICQGIHKLLNIEVVLKGKWIGPELFKGYWLDWKGRKIMKGIFMNRSLQGFGYLNQSEKKHDDDLKCIKVLEGIPNRGNFHKKVFSLMKNCILESQKLSYKGYFSKGHFHGNGVLKIQNLASLEHPLPISKDTQHFITSLQHPFPFAYTGYFTIGSFHKIGHYSFSESCITSEFKFWFSKNPLFISKTS